MRRNKVTFFGIVLVLTGVLAFVSPAVAATTDTLTVQNAGSCSITDTTGLQSCSVTGIFASSVYFFGPSYLLLYDNSIAAGNESDVITTSCQSAIRFFNSCTFTLYSSLDSTVLPQPPTPPLCPPFCPLVGKVVEQAGVMDLSAALSASTYQQFGPPVPPLPANLITVSSDEPPPVRAVPEPASLLLVGTGISSLACLKLRRRSKR